MHTANIFAVSCHHREEVQSWKSSRSLCDVSSGFSAHSVKCEQLLSFPAYSGKQCGLVSNTSGDLSPSYVCCLRKTFLSSVTRC